MRMNFEDYENRPFSKKYKLYDLTPTNIEKLIKDNLFEEQEPLSYFTDKIEDSTCFEPILYLQSVKYRISNTVQQEIYNTLLFLIEELNNLEYWEINVIEANIDARYTIDEKIEYLKEKRKELYLSIQNEPEYYVYIGKRDFNGFDNWKDYIFEIILHEEEMVIKYLTNDLQPPDIPKGIYNDWLKYFKMTEIINICENKIKELLEAKDLNNKSNPINESSSEEIEDINNINIDEKNLKTPIAIAMLNEIGFFELDSLKSLTDSKIAQIISIIQQKDPNDKSLNRRISGNIRVLDPNKKEDGLRYTSHKLSEKVKKILNEIK